MKSLPVPKILITCLLILLLAVFAFIFYFYSAYKQSKESTNWIIQTNEVLYKSEKVLSFLKDAETSTRGYVMTGDSTFLKPYFLSKDSIAKDIELLKKLTEHNMAQQARIKTLAGLAKQRLELCQNLQSIRANKNYPNMDISSLAKKGNAVMKEIRDTFENIQEEEHRLLVTQKNTSKQHEHNSNISFLLFLICFIALLIAVLVVNYFFVKMRKEDNDLSPRAQMIFFGKRIDEIVKGISDPLFALDKNFCILFYNDATQKVIGHGKRLGTKNFFELFPQYEQNIIGQKIKEVMQVRRSVSFEVFEDFGEQWMDVVIYPTSEGVSVYMKNAKVRKDHEKQLFETRHFLELTNELAHVGGWEIEIDSGKVKWTPVTRIIFETEPDIILDFNYFVKFFKEGKDRDTLLQVVSNAIDDQIGWDVELQIITAKGNNKWIRSKGEPLFEDGEFVKLIGSVQDVDPMKKLYDQLQKSEQRLRSALIAEVREKKVTKRSLEKHL